MAELELEREEEIQQTDIPEVEAPPEGSVVVNLDDDDDLPEQASGADPDTLDRRGRRSWIKETKKALAERDATIAEMKERMARLEGRASAPQQAARPEPRQEENPHVSQAQEYERQMRIIGRAIRNSPAGTPESEIQEMEESYRRYEAARIQALSMAHAPQPQPQAQGGQSVAYQMLVTEFPQLMADELLRQEASIEAQRLARQKRQPLTYAIAREANQRVAARHGIGVTRPAPSAGVQAKYTGVPARAGAGGGGNSITLDSATKKTAIAYWNNTAHAGLSDDAKIKMYVRNVLQRPE